MSAVADVEVALPDHTKLLPDVNADDVATLNPVVKFVGYAESPKSVVTADEPVVTPAIDPRSSKYNVAPAET